jgi:hypothetical protein
MKPVYIKTAAIACLISLACTTRVSEWVLLNAEPGQYTLVCFHKNPLDAQILLQNKSLVNELSGANVKVIDAGKSDAVQPYYGLYYENRLFTRYERKEQLADLASSPMRTAIADEIMKGKLCVMLYLQSGNREKDEKGIAAVRKAISISPFSAIIPIVELSRTDPKESHFVSLLLNVESDLKTLKEPMLFGIFGKFKALEPLVGGGITEENISYLIDFLTADCSCLIKDDLPGTDILYAGKWDSPKVALVNAILDANPALQHR